MKTYDAIVIGLGAMGSATCLALAQRGAQVLGIEQFDAGHALGSSGGDTLLIRLAYFEHPDYVPLARRAWGLWTAIEAESGERLLYGTGGLYLGPMDGPLVRGSLRSAREHHLPHELLDRAKLADRYPQFRVPDNYAAIHETQAGFLLCERAIVTQCRLAAARGAQVRTRETVQSWSADRAGARVTTDRGVYHAGRLIFTAGPWTTKLVKDLGIELAVTRQVLGWVCPRRVQGFRLGVMPCWALELKTGLLYGVPVFEGDSMKTAHHHRGPDADPDHLHRQVRPEDHEDFLPLVAQYLPDAQGPVQRVHICMYTYSPDGHFIVDRHPAHDNILLACGFSGHGFKFAPVIGQALAELAIDGATGLPMQFLSVHRFATGEGCSG
jgi:sarcosine oxidase